MTILMMVISYYNINIFSYTLTLVENKALAPVANCLLHRFCNRCNAIGTKTLTL
jgi:hypothetical protein